MSIAAATGTGIVQSSRKAIGRHSMNVKLSTLWIFVMFNYVYGDVVGLMDAKLLRQYVTGDVNGLAMTQGFLLGASVFMEIPIAMVLLSRVMNDRANRRANIVAGTVMTTVLFLTLFVGAAPTMHYVFFSLIEITGTAYIVWCAWKWRIAE